VRGDDAEIFKDNPCFLLSVSCLGKAAPLPPEKKIDIAYANSADGLKSEFDDFLGTWKTKEGDKARAIMRSLHLADPKSFFKATWGDDAGGFLAGEYDQLSPHMDEMQHVIMDLAKSGATEVKVTRFDNANDSEETTYQAAAIKAMKKPVPLYSVRITAPGHHLGQHFYSFIYLDGTFRYIGKTKQLGGTAPADARVDALAELRLKDAAEYARSGKLPQD
jgi:hypothetical protein